MALIYGGDGGDFLPYVGYNAKSDKWFISVDKQKVALKNPAFVADLGNIKTGWFMFQEGMAPNIVFDPSLTEPAAQPSGKHKRGAQFSVLMKGDHPGVYEFSTNSRLVMGALNKLHDEYLDGVKANAGKVPVIEVSDGVEVKSSFKNPDGSQGTATNYEPVFEIVKWVDRSPEFDNPAGEQDNKPAAEPVKKTSGASEF